MQLRLGEMTAAEIEKATLDTVLRVAQNDESRIRDGIVEAIRGENDKARRIYLWNTLERKAKEKIRRANRSRVEA